MTSSRYQLRFSLETKLLKIPQTIEKNKDPLNIAILTVTTVIRKYLQYHNKLTTNSPLITH